MFAIALRVNLRFCRRGVKENRVRSAFRSGARIRHPRQGADSFPLSTFTRSHAPGIPSRAPQRMRVKLRVPLPALMNQFRANGQRMYWMRRQSELASNLSTIARRATAGDGAFWGGALIAKRRGAIASRRNSTRLTRNSEMENLSCCHAPAVARPSRSCCKWNEAASPMSRPGRSCYGGQFTFRVNHIKRSNTILSP